MRKLLLAVLAIAVSPPLFAQNSGNITSNQSVCIGVSAEHSTVAVQVTGTWTGTLQPQVAVQGQAATNSQVVPSTSTTPAATITADGVYYANVGGLSQFCILGNTVSSGTAVIYLNVSKGVNASTLGGSGSGSGTVSANNTAAGAVANYAAAGGSTTVGPTTLNYVAPTLTVSTSGGGNGVLALSGNTSGTATFTAPATAGTVTNPILISNSTQLPGTTGTGYFVNGGTAYGLHYTTSNGPCLESNSSDAICATGTGIATVQGQLNMATSGNHLLFSGTAPTIAGAGCGGSAASIADNNGPASFAINTGTAPTSAGCAVTLPAATTAWNCWANDITTNSTSVFLVKQTVRSTTGATFVNFSDVAVATAPTANDIWTVHCFAD